MGHILRTYVRNKSQFGICTVQLYVRRYTKRRQKAIRTYVHMYICTYTLVSTWASVCVMCVRTYACRQRGQTQPNQRRQSTYARTQIFLFPPKRPQLPGTHVCTHLFGLVEKDEISRTSADRNVLHPSAPKPYVRTP